MIIAIAFGLVKVRLHTGLNCQFGYPKVQFVICLIISMSIELVAYGQTIHHSLTARYTSIGVYSKNFVDIQCVSSNQAALPNVKSIAAAIYSEKRFLLKELNLYSVAACLPVQFGSIGVSAKYFGYNDYNETQVSVAYGKALGKINIGIQFNYYSLRIQGYGKEALFNIEAGAIMKISEQVFAGLHIFNPTGSAFGNNKIEKLPWVYTAGLGYEASEKVYISAEIIKEEEKPIGINGGLQYVFAKKFFARFGLYTETSNLYFGLGWKWQTFRVDITTNYHPQLGLTPGLLLLFEGINKEE